MKKITFLALLSVLTLSSIAQNKFGYIDSQELLILMPERKAAETEVQNFAKSFKTVSKTNSTAGHALHAQQVVLQL